jgi:phage major head subunit gpT-like protein
MATPINTGTFAKAIWPGVRQWYGESYNDHKTEYTDLFETYSSTRNYEEEVGISGFGLASVKAEGAPIEYDTMTQGYTTRYTHVVYAKGFMITREMYDDDLYGVIGKKRAKALARAMRQTKEFIGANVYNRAFNSSYTGGDGKELVATDHPNVAGGTWSNELTVAAALSETSLENLTIQMMQATDDRGLKIALKPQKLIIPVDLWYTAQRLLKTDGRVGTNNNDINTIKGMFPGGVVVNHWLTSTTAWFIKSDAPDAMKYFSRREDAFDMDNDFDTENAKFKASMRFVFGWTDPRGLFGTAGA